MKRSTPRHIITKLLQIEGKDKVLKVEKKKKDSLHTQEQRNKEHILVRNNARENTENIYFIY